MGLGQEELEAVQRVMQKGMLSNYQGNWSDKFYGGEEIQALEAEWAEKFGVKHAIACNSASSGLWMACAAIGLQKDYQDIDNNIDEYQIDSYVPNEVIVTPYSMTISATVPLHFGAKPVFADIEPDYFCLDPKSVEEKITPQTKAIIVVDLFGCPYDADAINEIAERKGKEYGHKIYVIEDSAQAIGAKYKGRYAGTLGDIGVYSLNFHKHIHCGEGGIVVTNDDELAFRLRLLMNHSEAVVNDFYKSKDYTFGVETLTNVYAMIKGNYVSDLINNKSLVGMNFRMTELQAAIAREQLKKLDGILKVYRDDAKYFSVKVRPECESSYYRYAYIDKEYGKYGFSETDLNRIYFNVKQHYVKPIYQMPLFNQLGYPQDLCPVCESIDENIVLAWHKETP